MQTGTTHLVPLDDGNLQSGVGAVERRRIAARTATDHNDIELLGRGDHLLDCVRALGLYERVTAAGSAAGRQPSADPGLSLRALLAIS
ncbi:MAG: hypothetical protein NVSMB16_02160 [Acidimicrobiales bacterium]